MIKKFIEAISSQAENDKLKEELRKERKISAALYERCETLSNDNRKMYVRVKQYERKIREMREKNGKRNTRNKTTRISTKK